MKRTVQSKHTLNTSIENVWKNISKASGVNGWLPVITACRLEGQGEGAKRICSTEHGDMDETIIRIDHENKIFQYSINKQPLLPIENILGTMEVKEHSGSTELIWSLEFTLPDESSFTMVKQAVEDMYATGAIGLENISK